VFKNKQTSILKFGIVKLLMIDIVMGSCGKD